MAAFICLHNLSGCTDLSCEDYMEAGHDAVEENRYHEAEIYLLTAADLADHFAQDDLRRAVTLNNLGNLFDEYAGVLRATNRGVEAVRLENQSKLIRSLP